MYYSPDNSRVVEVVGEDREAFLYDRTNERPSDGHWLAAGVFDVRFIMEGEGDAAALRQIELAFRDPGTRAVLDVDGTRRVLITGPRREAVLSSLEDDTVRTVVLARDVVEVVMLYGEDGDLAFIEVVSQNNDETTRVIFDRDGLRPIIDRLEGSEAFRSLSSGVRSW